MTKLCKRGYNGVTIFLRPKRALHLRTKPDASIGGLCMKKLVTLVLALVLVAAVSCASATSIGVIQLVQHAALDLATQGFIDAVTAAIPDAEIEVQNASGDTPA